MKVTAKQDKFCRRYLIDFNATKAAIEIGFSKKTARQQASRLLSKVNIKQHIAKLQEEITGGMDESLHRMLKELYRISYFDTAMLYNKDGTMKSITSMPEDVTAAIQSVESDEIDEYVKGERRVIGISRKAKGYDKIRAMELAAKIRGQLNTLKISGTDEKGNAIKEFKVTLNL